MPVVTSAKLTGNSDTRGSFSCDGPRLCVISVKPTWSTKVMERARKKGKDRHRAIEGTYLLGPQEDHSTDSSNAKTWRN